MTALPPPLPWRVHLLIAGLTRLRLRLRDPGPGAPWAASRALRGLDACGATPLERPDVLGAGRGTPLLTRHRIAWHGLELHLECRSDGGSGGELRLELPPWDELVETPGIDEEALWELVDAVAAATDAQDGDIGDGEGPDSLAARLRRGAGDAYRHLPASGLDVVLR